jgi:hypothetical protein
MSERKIRNIIKLDHPAADWVQRLPLGNGRLGAIVHLSQHGYLGRPGAHWPFGFQSFLDHGSLACLAPVRALSFYRGQGIPENQGFSGPGAGSISGLRLWGEIRADISWREGKFARVVLTADENMETWVKYGNEKVRVSLQGGVPRRIGEPANADGSPA